MEKADISTLEKPDISILVLQSDLSFGYLSAERKSPVKIPILHADPALTLRVYAHAMLEEEVDLSFADFGSPGRPYTAPVDDEEIGEAANYANSMARREGFEPPTLRFEA